MQDKQQLVLSKKVSLFSCFFEFKIDDLGPCASWTVRAACFNL